MSHKIFEITTRLYLKTHTPNIATLLVKAAYEFAYSQSRNAKSRSYSES